ncbi:MAG TPA: M56 family metallopeptidase [Acidobacteriaceae bacterium]|jgi:beta-lactamase regulating signal transducer with metallopeptidase domain|nr:M56 family metallopeptidase [Acidobacteriaceae bacterium]
MSAFLIPAGMENFAQAAVGRLLNSLPEGLLLAMGAWLLLRLVGRQNAGTRFAVWLTTLLGVAGLPLLSGFARAGFAVGGGGSAVARSAEVMVPGMWAVAFVALWIPLVCVALARLIAGVWQVRTIRRGCTEVALADLDPALQAAMRPAGMRRSVRLMVAERARVPAAIGFWKPAIVLPAWCLRELSMEALQPILIHEMAHLQRRDDWTNLLQKLVRAVLFFHPAVWWIDARLAAEREMACDDAVLAATGNARAYAGSLIGLLERGCARRGWSMAQAAVARAREASVRIARILEGGASATTRVGRVALGLAAALSLACCGILEVAPRVVAFEPVQETAAQAQPLGQGELGMRDVRAPAVVPAIYHPADARRPLIVRKPTKARSAVPATKVPAERPAASEKESALAPPVVMAKLNESTPRLAASAGAPAMQVLMVVETAETEYVPAQQGAGAPLATNAGMAATAGARIVQIRTTQVVEETESGWQVRTYRVVLMAPAVEDGSRRSSI